MQSIQIISIKCGYIHDIHDMQIISMKLGYIHKMWIISTERGDPQNADNIRTNRKNGENRMK